jgi:hypothetical protein
MPATRNPGSKGGNPSAGWAWCTQRIDAQMPSGKISSRSRVGATRRSGSDASRRGGEQRARVTAGRVRSRALLPRQPSAAAASVAASATPMGTQTFPAAPSTTANARFSRYTQRNPRRYRSGPARPHALPDAPPLASTPGRREVAQFGRPYRDCVSNGDGATSASSIRIHLEPDDNAASPWCRPQTLPFQSGGAGPTASG